MITEEQLNNLADTIRVSIEDYENTLYNLKLARDLMALSDEDLSRLTSDERHSVNVILDDLITANENDVDLLYSLLESYYQDMENYIDKATQGRGVRY
jgi:hypothetical protein